MKNLCLLLMIGFISNRALGFRIRRHTPDEQESGLKDRYGWTQEPVQQQFPWQFPSQYPGQLPNQYPWQEQVPGQFPWQEQVPGQFPWQGRVPGQFPWQERVPGQFPGIGKQRATTSTTATPPSAANEATTSSAIRACITNCPVTSEYNPVCGTDRTTYTNPGRLACAQACGVRVTLFRTFPCVPTTTPAQ